MIESTLSLFSVISYRNTILQEQKMVYQPKEATYNLWQELYWFRIYNNLIKTLFTLSLWNSNCEELDYNSKMQEITCLICRRIYIVVIKMHVGDICCLPFNILYLPMTSQVFSIIYMPMIGQVFNILGLFHTPFLHRIEKNYLVKNSLKITKCELNTV